MNDLELEQQMLDEEIKKMRLENQLAAYSAQMFEKKRQLLELKKSELVVNASIKELQDKINALRS